jgi:hypothetical protein
MCNDLSELKPAVPPPAQVNAGLSFLCMMTAALAAGLTMGVVSLDELDLRIKQRSEDPSERAYASKLLPLIQMEPHHQLLVTLLLLNSIANEVPHHLQSVAWHLVGVARARRPATQRKTRPPRFRDAGAGPRVRATRTDVEPI